MKTQQGLFLTKKVENNSIIFSHINENTFKLTFNAGKSTIGKGGYSSNGEAINLPKVKENSIIITKSEMKRLGTYKAYYNGIDLEKIIFGAWQDKKGRTLFFENENDVYYYFRRHDCGLILKENQTIFHKPISQGVEK